MTVALDSYVEELFPKCPLADAMLLQSVNEPIDISLSFQAATCAKIHRDFVPH
jgi:hypothetical protein